MNRNQKIGIGCGVLGCLGLIVVVIGVIGFLFWRSQQRGSDFRERPNRNFNFNTNSNSNSNDNSNSGSNDNSESSNSPEASSSTSSYSDDDKHKLYQAAATAADGELLQKVSKRLGLLRPSGMPTDEYSKFVENHVNWVLENQDFILSINTPEKARAYVDAHLDD
jgi:hypothetical protein